MWMSSSFATAPVSVLWPLVSFSSSVCILPGLAAVLVGLVTGLMWRTGMKFSPDVSRFSRTDGLSSASVSVFEDNFDFKSNSIWKTAENRLAIKN